MSISRAANPRAGHRYESAHGGDINAFFGLMLDNVGDMILMASLLVGVFGLPGDFVLTRMIPGTAVGVLVGDLIFTAMAFRLARRIGPARRDGDAAGARHARAPSASVFLIIGPAFQAATGRGLGPDGGGAARLVPGHRHDPGLGGLQAGLRPGQRLGPPAGAAGPGCSAR